MLNARGNQYSRTHTFMEPNSATEFWNFSFEEMGNHDVPAAVDYILSATGKGKLTLFGFSQGTTVLFHSLAMNKGFYAGKVKKMIALAPTITLKYS
jgi:lysosomal acid lipase/cholesteryl ester hydrolase